MTTLVANSIHKMSIIYWFQRFVAGNGGACKVSTSETHVINNNNNNDNNNNNI